MEEKIDFLFIHVPKRNNYYKPIDDFMFINYIPMGVFALSDLLNRSGHRSRILHLGIELINNMNFSLIKWLADKEIKVIGFSIHWHFQAYDVIEAARKVREHYPDIRIVLGGYTASLFAREILKNFNCIDAVFCGDAEIPVRAFMNSFGKEWQGVPNLVWRNKDVIEDNGISYVAEEEDISLLNFGNMPLLYNHEYYVKCFSIPLFWMNNGSFQDNMRRQTPNSPVFPLFVGRGCNVDCSFCGGSRSALKKIGNRTRVIFRSIPSVLQTIKEALSYGYKTMNVCFHPDPARDGYFINLFKAIREAKLNVGMNFECWGLPTEDFLKEFRLTFPEKISSLAFSPESGSEEVRKLNKGIYYTNKQLFDSLVLLKKYKVKADIFFTIGIVGETEQNMIETRKLIHKLLCKFFSVINRIMMIPVQIEPASPIFENPGKYGFKVDRKCFMDFYHSHGRTDTGPYNFLACSKKDFFGQEMDSYAFSKKIEELRCKYFCHITPNFLRVLNITGFGRFICGRACFGWQKRGFGKPSEKRQTFV